MVHERHQVGGGQSSFFGSEAKVSGHQKHELDIESIKKATSQVDKGHKDGLLAVNVFHEVGAVKAMETSFVQNGEANIFVRAHGHGPLIVLLPSQARDSDDYDALADELVAGGLRVLRPQPRGIGRSTGPIIDITLRDLAEDVACVIDAQKAGPAVIFGHAFGHYVARMVAHAFPLQVAGVIVAAAAARSYPAHLSQAVTQSGDLSLPDATRLAALRLAFFAPGNDPRSWLEGWFPHMQDVQRKARLAIPQDIYWAGGAAPMLDLQPEFDPFKPAEKRNEMKEEFGERVTIAMVRDASHALIPEQPKAAAEAVLEWVKSISYL